MIGLFGGTFDPIHHGHLRAVLDVRELVGLDQVRLVPLSDAVHRDQPAAPAEIRLAMVQAAVTEVPGLLADDREISRGGRSYTYDTLKSLRAQFGAEVPLALILGADAFNGFLSWHRPLDVLALAHVILMERPGHRLQAQGELAALVESRRCLDPMELRQAPAGRIHPVAVSRLEISSTDIRRRAAAGRNIDFLVPPGVASVIRALGLYRSA